MTDSPVGVDDGVVGRSNNSKDRLLCCVDGDSHLWRSGSGKALGESQVILAQSILGQIPYLGES